MTKMSTCLLAPKETKDACIYCIHPFLLLTIAVVVAVVVVKVVLFFPPPISEDRFAPTK